RIISLGDEQPFGQLLLVQPGVGSQLGEHVELRRAQAKPAETPGRLPVRGADVTQHAQPGDNSSVPGKPGRVGSFTHEYSLGLKDRRDRLTAYRPAAR